MTELEHLMTLLPIVFMLHEYEEVIMFKQWLLRNKKELNERFPKFGRLLTRRHVFEYSTATFAVGTVHEFILVAVISYCAVWQHAYQWWFAVLVGHTLHLLIHLAQWMIYRKYVPVLVTSLLTLPYCIYTFLKFTETTSLSLLQMLLWALIGVFLTGVSLLSAHCLMSGFHRWQVGQKLLS